MTIQRAAPPFRSSIVRPFTALRAGHLSSVARRPSFVVSQAVLWLICCALFLALWDRWLIEGGPHGSYRWVGMDFIPYWVGARAMLQGQSPYSLETTLAIQQAIFGGLVRPGEDPMKFVYPASAGILFIPLAVLPLPWAAALWCGTLLWGSLNLLGGLAMHLGRASLPRMALWFVLFTVGGSPFIVIAVSKGQLILLSLLTLIAAWRLWRRNEMAAGALLALAALKPTVALWPIGGILLWAAHKRRWRLWLSLGAVSLGLVALSQAMIGNWLPDFLELAQAKGDAPVLWSLELAPWPWRGLYALMFAGLLLWAAWIAWRRNDPAPWLAGSLLFGVALSPIRWIYDLLLAWAMPVLADAPRRWGSAALGLALLSPWGFALIPAPARWAAMVIGVPLFWAGAWVALYASGKGTMDSTMRMTTDEGRGTRDYPQQSVVRRLSSVVQTKVNLVVAALLIVDIGITYAFLTQGRPGATDFYSRWVGARAYFQQGLSPYSDEVSRQIQAGIYGRPLRPGEDLYLFAYPFYVVFVIAPLTLLPYPWAAAVWLVVLQASLAGALLLALDLYRWRLPPGLMTLLGLWTLLFYPHWRGLLLGQFIILVFLLLALTLWALSHRRDGLAGVALALTTIKPQSVFLVIPFLLLWAISQWRWRFVRAFAFTLGALGTVSFFMHPGWLAEFLQQVLAYPAYTAYPPYLLTSATWVLAHVILPMLGTSGEIGVTLALLAGLGWAWWREARSGWASFHWTLGLTLVVSHLAVPRTATPNYIVFLLPLIALLHYLYQRAGAFALVTALFALFLGLWLVFLALGSGVGDLAVLIGMPLLMLPALFWGRGALARPLEDQ